MFKHIPKNINDINGITSFAFIYGLLLSVMGLVMPDTCETLKNSLFMIIGIKLLTSTR